MESTVHRRCLDLLHPNYEPNHAPERRLCGAGQVSVLATPRSRSRVQPDGALRQQPAVGATAVGQRRHRGEDDLDPLLGGSVTLVL